MPTRLFERDSRPYCTCFLFPNTSLDRPLRQHMKSVLVYLPPMWCVLPVAMDYSAGGRPMLPAFRICISLPKQEMKIEVFVAIFVIGNHTITPIPLRREIPRSIFPFSTYARCTVCLREMYPFSIDDGSKHILVKPKVLSVLQKGWPLIYPFEHVHNVLARPIKSEMTRYHSSVK